MTGMMSVVAGDGSAKRRTRVRDVNEVMRWRSEMEGAHAKIKNW
jgi:hypothetical protein